MNYREDPIGRRCLTLAAQSKSRMKFGAVLVKSGKVIGTGWNRLSTLKERKLLSHVDYAIHAEQAAIAYALLNGRNIKDSEIFVLGFVAKDPRKLSQRAKQVFICKKCPHSFLRFGIAVNIPHISGWIRLTAEEAARTASVVCGKGYWTKFATT